MTIRFFRVAAFVFLFGLSAEALASAPTATTNAATSLTTSSAVLNGTGTPAGQDATGWFRYDTTSPGTCNDTFGTRVPTTGGTDLGTGTVAVAYSITATGLISGTTYYFCAIVSNASGMAFGNVLSFTVPGAPTLTTTSAATSVTSTTATLNGSADPTGASTTGYFRYDVANPGTCNDTFGTRSPASGGAALGAGSSAVSYSQALTGLLPGTTYYFCAISNNAYGTGFGSVLSFTPPAIAPVVVSNGVSPLAGTTAQLNGYANPGGADTSGWFRYSTTNPTTCNDAFGTRVPASGGTDLGAGNSNVSFNQALTGLTQATTYYFCAIASNSVGTAFGALQTFTTLQQPTVTTGSVTSLTNTSTTLNGTANPNGDTTTAWFRYAATNPGTCNNTFGSAAPTSGGVSLGAGSSASSFSQSITGLSSGTTYYYCALAMNNEGLSVGNVLTFTTLSQPTVTTSAATTLTSSSATLNGSANPDGASTTAWFRYSTANPGSCTNSFGTQAPTTPISLGSPYATTPFAQGITGLTPNTVYYYCAIAQNTYGTVYGSVVSFTTQSAAPTVSTNGASPVTGMAATLNGYANPGGADTTGWFRYDVVSPGTCNDTFGTRAPASGGIDVGAGIVNTSFTQAITGLTANKTYYFCALASNSIGSAVGTVQTFTTPLPPTVTTAAASSISNTTAYLNGTANPNNAQTGGWFRYSTTSPGASCNDTFGTRVPASGTYSVGSGTTAQGFNEYVSGLTQGTTYYFCAIASNSEGTAFGSVLSFTTVAPPTVTTLAATALTSSTATLNGSASPNGYDTGAWFRYSTTNPGTCSDSFGTRVPASGSTDLGSGYSAVGYSDAISGLLPVTTYYVCAIANNGYGTMWGSVVSFTTTAAAPVMVTSSVSPLDGTTATLNGYGNPEGADTTGWFRYSTTNPGTCNDTFGTRAPATGGTDLGSGTSYSGIYSQALTGLTANTTYYFCAIGSNSIGTAVGTIQSFITPLPPTATTTSASSIGNTYAYLYGSGVANNAATTGWFRYAATAPMTCNDTFGSRVPATGGVSLGSGTTSTSYSEYISGLSAGTTYYFCAIDSNSEGTAFGSVLSFTTATVPAVTTQPATSISSSAAVVNGSAIPNGADTTAWLRYSTANPGTCSDSFGIRLPSSGGTDLGTGSSAVSFAQSATSLTPATTYYYCAIASNAYGTSFGAIVSFTTPAAAPTVTTTGASSLTGTTGTLNGSSNPGGADTTGWFRYATASPGSCNDTFGTRVPATGGTDIGSGVTTTGFSQNVTGLTAGTTYYYCALVSNSVGSASGSVLTFTTPVPPTVVTTSASSIGNNYAYLYGTANPNSGATTGWFRYDTTNPTTCNDTFGTRVPATGGYSVGSGTTATSYYEYVSGLNAGTTYYYCALASNAAGTAMGVVVPFTTASGPTFTTQMATSVTSSSAVLNGTGVPNEADTTAWFRYSTTNPTTCSDSFGTRVPASGGTDLGAGTAGVAFAQSISGLTPNTAYYVCAIGSNAYGTNWGSVVTVTTLAAAPTVVTTGVSNATGTTVTLNGSANPDGADTTGWFRYSATNPTTCNDTFGTRVPATGGTDLGSGITSVAYLQALTGLTAGTTYYYCALASNSVGSAVGTVVTFTTPLVPTVTTTAATSLGNTYAYLNGSANPNNSTTTSWFRYATTSPGTCNDTFGSRAPTSGGNSLGSGGTATTFQDYISGLSPATTYYFCAIAQNTQGTAFGSILTFTTLAPPTVTTGTTTSITSSSAVLNGSGISNGADTTGWFRYTTTFPGTCSDSFGTRVPASGGTDLGTGTTSVAYAQTISGLLPSTTYYYCAIDSNAYGTALGAISSFVTTAAAPTVTTSSASALTGTTATLNGYANPGGADATAWFRYSTASPGTCNDQFGTRSPATSGTDLGAGISNVNFSQNVTGLTPGVTYYFCALSSNATGSGVGSVLQFTTPLPPAVTTLAATPITATTATLNGYGNGNGYTATGWFRYDTTNPTICNDSFGTRIPATSGVSLSGTGTSYSEALTNLTPGTLYYFCAIASSSVGTGYGSVLTFTTASAVPTVTTIVASGLGSGAATLNGSAIPNGSDTTAWFRYDTTNPTTCNDTFGTRVPVSGGQDLGSGNSAATWSQALSGLTNGVTYYYCAIASNAIGTSFGSVVTFNTSVPTVTTQAASSVTNAGATLNGSANPNGAATTGWFRYSATNPGSCSDTFGSRTPASGGTSLGTGSSAVPYTAAITGLTASTTYYFCALASSASGTGYGSVLTFTTAGPPTVTTNAATSITTASATLKGAANPNAADATGWFRYSVTNPGTCSDSFGTRTPASGGTDVGAGTTSAPFTQAITSLAANTTYYVCAIASNTYGTSFGTVVSFTTTAGAPAVSTVGGTPLTGTTAQLNGSANPDGADTIAWFRYDTSNPGTCDDVFGTRAPTTSGTDLGAGNTVATFSQSLTGLTAGTTYYFCAIASNSAGKVYGTIASFTMPALPVAVTSAASSVTNTAATLNGSGNPAGATATGWFRYDLTNPGTCNDTFGTRAPASSGTALGAGSSAVTYSQAITGLAPLTTYYYCAIVSNTAGEGVGSVQTFTTSGAPTVTTNAATTVSATAATLNGSAVANGADTTGWFRYATTNPGTCNDTFGTRAPVSSGTDVGAGTGSLPWSQGISGLTPGTTYYVCALASNTYGSSTGTVLSFTTLASKPVVNTIDAIPLSGTTAQLDGSANPGGGDTTGWFRYDVNDPGICDDTFGTRAPASSGTDLGAGTGTVSFSQQLSGLTPGTTYYACAIASNASGKGFGAVLSFTAPVPPTVVTSAASSVMDTSATLNGGASPNGAATTGWFRYDVTNPGTCTDAFGTRIPASGGVSLGSGSVQSPFSEAISNLSPLTTYYFCALASSGGGTSAGTVLSFTTPTAPTIATGAATMVTSTSATLKGFANPNGSDTTGWFRYGTTTPGTCNDTFGTRAPASGGTDLGAGTSTVPWTQAISGLTPGTTYYVCALGSNVVGTSVGTVVSFTAPAAAPTVTTVDALPLTGTTAKLDGTATPDGGDTTGWFRYDVTNPGTCNDSFGTRAPASGGTDVGSTGTAQPFSQTISGLTPGTTYYACAIAANTSGTAFGAVLSLTAPVPPTVITSAPSAITNASATLNGSANPNGTATTGWFRYDVTNPGTCSDTFGTRVPASGGMSLGSGSSAAPFSLMITVFNANTTYYVCALASNAGGTGTGTVQTFTTAAAPTVATSAATLVTSSSATLNGTATPNGADTTGWFRYSATNPGSCNDTFGTRIPASGGTDLGSGMSATPWTQAVSALIPGATYYYCAIASNTYGTSVGTVASFTTPAAAPTVTTVDALPLTSTTAKLDGSATPDGGDTTGWFRYASTSPGSCNDTFGTRAPASGGTDVGSTGTAQPFSQTISGLTPGTTYYACAIAANTSGTSFGAVLSFTAPVPPTVITSAASAITNASATLNGSANPNGTATTGWFRYDVTNPGTCGDTFGTRLPASGGMSLGSGSTAAPFSQAITGLSANTTYYVCALASNAGGTGTGTVQTFTTAAAPTVATSAATLVTSSSATLNGTGTPNGADTTGWFRYSATNPGSCNDTFGTRAPASGGTDLGSGMSATPWTQAVSALIPGATYYYCAIASNTYGTSVGTVASFTTPAAAPTVTTVDALPLTSTTAKLDGSATPDGGDTTGWFRYASTNPGSCNDTFGTRTPASGGTDLGAGSSAQTFSQTVSGLTPGTTYYACAIASNASGTAFGAVLSFATPVPPTVTTMAASIVASTSATLNGSANPNANATMGWFRYDVTNPGTCNNTFGTPVPSTGGTSLGAGSSAAPFSQSVSGLLPTTTYYFCALASNAGGIVVGSVLTFTTTAGPSVTTQAATQVTATSATMNGSANPNGVTATGWFRYDVTNPGSCSDSFGTRAPASGGTSLGSGTSLVNYMQSVSGLAPGTTYYYCALASSTFGVSAGAVSTFTTPALVPVVTTVDAMPRSGTTAQLDGTANPGGGDTTAWFRYDTTNPGFCDDSFGTRTPTNGGTDLGAGTSAESFSAMLTGLSPGTTYYACAIASNASGTSFGAVLSFTAPVPPTVLTTTATAISSTQATLNGSANPNGTATTGWLRYDLTSPGTCNDTFGTRVPATGGTSLGAGQAAAAFSQIVTGLSSTTTYYFCAIASSTGGVAVGTVLSFTTSAAPTVTTSAATQVTSSSATLNASAGANGSDTTGWFRYGTTSPGTCNDTFGTRLPSTGGTDLGSGFSATPYTQAVSGLTPGTTYYYCALASNSFGTGFGSVLSFTATAVAPTVTTSAATLITGSTAQLNGSANPGGADATGWFRYDTTSPGSCSDGFGTRVPATGGTDLGSGNTAVPFSEALTGLSAGTTYYFCALTSNSQGTSSGTVLSFTTEQPPTVTTSPATSVTAGTATLNGSANPNGVNATGWFRYDTTNPGSCGDTFGTRIPVTGGSNLGAGTTAAAYSQAVTGLNPGTTYYFCALASSSAGTSSGAVATFTTAAAPPTVMTDPATQVTVTTATLNGSATPNGGATTAWFRYSATNPHTCNDTFGTRTPATGGTALGAGLTAAAFSQDITGLLPTTTYYFCAIASNSAGAAVVGTLASFTTPAPNTPPAVTTVAATALTSSSATMNGTANPNLASTTGWFRFSPTNPGSCDDAFGTRVPATGGTQVGAGGSAAAFAETMTGLAPATTYYFCAIASNASGTSFGGVLSWTTLADAPIVTTTAPTGVHVDMATLNGSATPNGADTSGWFRYDTTSPGTCNDTFGTRVPATGGVDLGGGSTASPYSEMITGLVPGTSYFFCAIAANTVGTSYGSVLSFSPGALAPVVTTDAATAIMGTGATLAGTVNPNALDTTGWFRYGPTQPTTCDDSFGQRAPETGGIDIPAGTSPAGYTQAVTGLMPATTYYFCAAASNQGGATFGGVRSFTTAPALPQVVTGTPMLGGTAGSVTLSGMANPGGADAMGWFRYDTSNPGTCTDSFGTRVPATGGIDLGTGMSEKPFSDAVTGLSPGTYYVCALASNSSGTGVGGALSFVIPKPTPSGSTKSGGCACRAGTGASDSVLWLLPFVLLAIPRRRRSVP